VLVSVGNTSEPLRNEIAGPSRWEIFAFIGRILRKREREQRSLTAGAVDRGGAGARRRARSLTSCAEES
jgi:hypothetical protein